MRFGSRLQGVGITELRHLQGDEVARSAIHSGSIMSQFCCPSGDGEDRVSEEEATFLIDFAQFILWEKITQLILTQGERKMCFS